MATVTITISTDVTLKCAKRDAKKYDDDGETTDVLQAKIDGFCQDVGDFIAKQKDVTEGGQEVDADIQSVNTEAE